MTQTGPLQWRTGAGWLVLLGGGRWEENEIIHSQAISAISDESPIAFLPAADPDPTVGEAFLSFYTDLGAPHGYVVPDSRSTLGVRSGQLPPIGKCQSDLHRRWQPAAFDRSGGRHARHRSDRDGLRRRRGDRRRGRERDAAGQVGRGNRPRLAGLGLGVRRADRAAIHRRTVSRWCAPLCSVTPKRFRWAFLLKWR